MNILHYCVSGKNLAGHIQFLNQELKLCFVAFCPPVNLENGQVDYTQPQENGEYPTHTAAIFTCDDGYMKNGTLFIICLSSGMWSLSTPTCGILKNTLV